MRMAVALAWVVGLPLTSAAAAEPAALLAASAPASSSGPAPTPTSSPTTPTTTPARVDATALDVNATGIFINEAGDVLTARHVVAACRSLFVIKDARVARARVKVLGTDHDLAVVGSALRPLLAAAFAHTPPGGGTQPVFAAGYDALRRMPDRATAVFNGLTRPGAARADDLTLLLPATHGASGAAVLDGAGRVIGVITDRADVAAGDPRAIATRADAARYVVAVPVDAIKTFLHVNGIPYEETDAPQLEPLQPHAARAATLQVGILCGG